MIRVMVFASGEDSVGLFKHIQSSLPRDIAEFEIVDSKSVTADLDLSGVSLAFVDSKLRGNLEFLHMLAGLAIYTVLVIDEEEDVDHLEFLDTGLIDDLLLRPVRLIEVLGKIKHVAHLLRAGEVQGLNKDLKLLIEKIEEDVRTARSIQKALIPEKFPVIKGIHVHHKYLAGLKSGGDYLDVFEFADGRHFGILMSDSTGYGLSSAFMAVLFRLAIKLSKEEVVSPAATLQKIYQEIELTMKPTESLSIIYAVVDKKTFEMKYCSVGDITGFVCHDRGKVTEALEACTAAIVRGDKPAFKDSIVDLMPEDRLFFCTDGFREKFRGKEEFKEVLEASFTSTESSDGRIAILNEMVYRVKNEFESADDMPMQDCSGMVIDLDSKLIRLAPPAKRSNAS